MPQLQPPFAEQIQRETPFEGHAQAEAYIEKFPDDTEALDDALEAEVRQIFEGREGEFVVVDDGQPITIREMFSGFERDVNDIDGLRICAGGAR